MGNFLGGIGSTNLKVQKLDGPGPSKRVIQPLGNRLPRPHPHPRQSCLPLTARPLLYIFPLTFAHTKAQSHSGCAAKIGKKRRTFSARGLSTLFVLYHTVVVNADDDADNDAVVLSSPARIFPTLFRRKPKIFSLRTSVEFFSVPIFLLSPRLCKMFTRRKTQTLSLPHSRSLALSRSLSLSLSLSLLSLPFCPFLSLSLPFSHTHTKLGLWFSFVT